VYGARDLVGTDTFGGAGQGGLSEGGSSSVGATGGSGARGGTGTGGTLSGGTGGKPMTAGGTAQGGVSATTGGGKGVTGGNTTTGGKGSSTGGEEDTGGSVATGGTGGSVSTGGAAGGTSGGSPATTGGDTTTGGTVSLPAELIDNMEDGDQNIVINTTEGRNGAWYTASGKGGSADPVPAKAFMMPEIVGTPGVTDSLRAMHFVGVGGTEWGAMAAFDFKASVANAKVPYDSGTYKGISFWAKAAAAVTIQVRIPIPQTTSGACATDGCENHYAASAPLTTAWKKITLLWTGTTFLQDPSWGYKTAFDRTQMLSVQFVVPKGFSAEFWIDDVSFVP
jgi:hypothetical protein